MPQMGPFAGIDRETLFQGPGHGGPTRAKKRWKSMPVAVDMGGGSAKKKALPGSVQFIILTKKWSTSKHCTVTPKLV